MNVELKAFTNRQFTFVVKSPSTSWFLKKAAGIETGSGTPGHAGAGKVHWKQIYEIAEIKKQDPGLE
jgi:large subunit ribosomal protein L11